MKPIVVHRELLETTRGRIIHVLREGRRSVDEIAAKLGVTGNAVRAHLLGLERDGLVRKAELRRGATRPSQTYELTPELEHLLSRAYLPLLTHLVRVLAARETAPKFDALMREAGRAFAQELSPDIPSGPLATRLGAASDLLNRELGATTELRKRDGTYVIEGNGCPLAALTGKHPGVCHAIESFLTVLLQAPVRECCDRSERPRCCFQVSAARRFRSPADH